MRYRWPNGLLNATDASCRSQVGEAGSGRRFKFDEPNFRSGQRAGVRNGGPAVADDLRQWLDDKLADLRAEVIRLGRPIPTQTPSDAPIFDVLAAATGTSGHEFLAPFLAPEAGKKTKSLATSGKMNTIDGKARSADGFAVSALRGNKKGLVDD